MSKNLISQTSENSSGKKRFFVQMSAEVEVGGDISEEDLMRNLVFAYADETDGKIHMDEDGDKFFVINYESTTVENTEDRVFGESAAVE